jgi:hypothetical protein
LLNLIGGLDTPTAGSITVAVSASINWVAARWQNGARRTSVSSSSSTT